MSVYNYPLCVIKPLAFLGKLMPKTMLNIRYFAHHKQFINWKRPRNLHEYALTLLFHPKTDLDMYARLADKVAVREFVTQRIGEKYLTRLYNVYQSAEDIKVEELPDRFVLKTNHGCGNNFVVKHKEELDYDSSLKLLDYWMNFPYGDLTGQIHYSRIKPLIFAEEYLQQTVSDDSLPYDYKFFCFNGEPKYILYYEGRALNQHETPNMLFDLGWNPLEEAVLRPTSRKIPRPASLEEMICCARALSAGFEFVRVDFYEINNRPVFGEMTFTPDILVNIKKSFTDLMSAFNID